MCVQVMREDSDVCSNHVLGVNLMLESTVDFF